MGLFEQIFGPSDKEVKVVHSEHPITISIGGCVYMNVNDPFQWVVKLDSESNGLVLFDIQNVKDLDKLIDKLLEHRTAITK